MNIDGKQLADRIFWSKKSRVQAEKRLRTNDLASQVVLLWYSVFTVCISIFELSFPSGESQFPTIMVVLSVLILCASLFVGNRNFKERSMILKQCYEELGSLESKCFELDKVTIESEKTRLLETISDGYSRALTLSENHDDNDFKNALIQEYLNTAPPRTKLTRKPTIYNVFEVVIYTTLKYLLFSLLAIIPLFTLLLR
ncbi:SLATT domain-containing protein [Shewanella baltica]|uniref:SLATT domain-containing protein n=1 Tax=Shewanella baltica TaxID=62322 RepID=UPI003D7BC2D7